jgi:integrase
MAHSGRLSALRIAALIRAGRPGHYGDGGGLYLQISHYGGSTSWIFRYRVGGRLRDAGLGSTDTWSLKEARERARKFRQMRADGIDPIEQRRAERVRVQLQAAKAMSFKQCAEAYIAAHRPGWKNSVHAKQWPRSLETYAYPFLADLPIGAIDTALVMKAVEPIWQTKPETASRVRGRIESILDWARTRGFRDGENPARWRGHLENLLPKKSKVRRVEHHAALPYAELPTFMTELRSCDGIAARALEFAILTAARTGEAIGARWSEFDLAERLWTIPGWRTKVGREHRIPLSDPALAIVDRMAAIRSGDFIFFGTKTDRPLSNMAMLMQLRRMGRGDLTVHGFRSTFADWCAERTAFASEVRELALSHAVGSQVEQAYRRGDLLEKRRQLAEAWARFCTTPTAEGRVVALRAP